MKDKRLKQLLDEYAAIPRTDRDKDLAKRQDKADVVLSPAPAEPTRRRFKLRYLAAGLSFAIVAAIAIPLAVLLPGKVGENVSVEYAADMGANPNGSGFDGPQSGAPSSEQDAEPSPGQPYDLHDNGTDGVNYDPNPMPMPDPDPDPLPALDPDPMPDPDPAMDFDSLAQWSENIIAPLVELCGKFQSIADKGVYEAVDVEQYNALNDTSILPLSKEFGGRYRLVAEEEKEFLFATSLTPANSAVYVYVGYEGYAYAELSDLSQLASWRDIWVEYRLADDNYQVRFVLSDVYYVVQWANTTGDDNVADVLSRIFA